VVWDGMTEAGFDALDKVLWERRVAVQMVHLVFPLILGTRIAESAVPPYVLLPARAANIDTPNMTMRVSSEMRRKMLREAARTERKASVHSRHVRTDSPLISSLSDGDKMSFLEKLSAAQAETPPQPADPWLLPLERLRGKISDDGIERVATQVVFDFLEVPQRSRGAGACRRLARLMQQLRWRPIKARGLNQRGLLEQIRGYARHTSSPLS